ncbi:hypothetical protein ACLOJK_011203 [Asimina triloba]
MKLWATNEVRAKSKFWYCLRKLKKVKKSNGQVLAVNEPDNVSPASPFSWYVTPNRVVDCHSELRVVFGLKHAIDGYLHIYYVNSCSLPKEFSDLPTIGQIFEKNPTVVGNYGIWLRYQSRTGYQNMYREYRDTTLNGAVEQMYNEMASRHRVRFPCNQIIKTATVRCCFHRASVSQFEGPQIKFRLVFKKARPPTRKLKTTFKASGPNLFM